MEVASKRIWCGGCGFEEELDYNQRPRKCPGCRQELTKVLYYM